MNIKGLEKLMEMKFPIMKNTILFRKLSEIPEGHMDAYGDKPLWAMRGFNYKNARLTDEPYTLNEGRVIHGFSRRELRDVFERLQEELAKKGILEEDRIYFVCEVFTDKDALFSGLASKEPYEIWISFFYGNRPSRRDSDPNVSVRIPTFSEKPQLQYVSSLCPDFKSHAIKIAKDLISLPDNTSVDFTCKTDGYFFYHDLWQLANHK